jgi:hypothetical protein
VEGWPSFPLGYADRSPSPWFQAQGGGDRLLDLIACPHVLVKWPAAPSVASLDNFDNLLAAVYRTLSTARTTLSRMRGDRRTD